MITHLAQQAEAIRIAEMSFWCVWLVCAGMVAGWVRWGAR